MKLLYSSPDTLQVGHIRNLLDAVDIDSELRNEFLAGGMGELPPTEAWPELWVEERDYARAREVLDEFLQPQAALPDWTCRFCGERIEGQFSACWRCGTERPAER